MVAARSFVDRHGLVLFFAMAYALSWAGFLLAKLVPGFPMLFPFGSVVAALVMSVVGGGVAGLKELAGRCFRWRVPLRWYGAAWFVPAGIAVAVVGLNVALGAPTPAPDRMGPWYAPVMLFPVAMLDAPLWEDAGWRGYAMPRFPAERSELANTLLLGLLLAGWHLPLALSAGAAAAPYALATVASAVVTNWVYYNGRESALMAVLYHTSANTLGLLSLRLFSGPDATRYYWLLAGVNCIVAIVIAWSAGPILRRSASGKVPAAAA